MTINNMPSKEFTIIHKLNWTTYPPEQITSNPGIYEDEQITLFNINKQTSRFIPSNEDSRNILIHSRFRQSPKIIICAKTRSTKKRFNYCFLWHFCKSCASYKSYKMKEKFRHIPIDNFYFITISHNKPINMDTDTYMNGLFFKPYRKRINDLYKNRLTDSYSCTQEVSIRSLYPKLTVNPHIHIILNTSDIDSVISYLSKRNLNIKVDPIPSIEDREKVIDYMYKPIDLVTPYLIDFEKHSVKVNKNVTSFIESYSYFMTHKHQAYSKLDSYSSNPEETANSTDATEIVEPATLAI